MIVEKKKELSVKLKYAEASVITLYEGLQIIRSTQPSEDALRERVKRLGCLVTDIEEQVSAGDKAYAHLRTFGHDNAYEKG